MIEINNIEVNRNPVHLLNEIDREFVERINNRITLYGQIPYTVPTRLIIEMMKECALSMYRHSYSAAKQELWFRIPLSEIVSFVSTNCTCNNPECKTFGKCNCNTNTGECHSEHHVHPNEPNSILPLVDKNIKGYAIKLPPFVMSIRNIIEVGSSDGEMEESDNGNGFGISSYSVSTGNSSIWGMGNNMGGINQHLYQIERVVKMQEQTLDRSIYGNKNSVPHDWNRLTKTLMINKKLSSSLMLQCVCNVPIQYLYEDDLFVKYVFARCKKELKRLIAGHTFQLPGDVQLNADEICYGADDEIQSVEETLKGYNGTGDIILM